MSKNNPIEVTRLIKDGHSPCLPFEHAALHATLGALGVEQKMLGRLLGEAMGESSETWHDNAAADAINLQSTHVSGRAERIITELRTARVLDYPDIESRDITLGSIISIIYSGDTKTEHVLLTGISRTRPCLKGSSPYPTNLEIVTVRSPLGFALLDLTVGSVAMYDTGNRPHTVEIIDVQQFNPAYLED